MTFQPYQEATEEMRKQSELPMKLIKKGAGLASIALGGGSILSRVLPLLSKFVPTEMAEKGLSKIDSRFGKFISSAKKMGHNFDEIRDFIGEKIAPGLQEEESEEEKKERERVDSLSKFNQQVRSPKQASDFSRDNLAQQFDQGQQQSQGKAALLQTMQQITQALRQMRGNG